MLDLGQEIYKVTPTVAYHLLYIYLLHYVVLLFYTSVVFQFLDMLLYEFVSRHMHYLLLLFKSTLENIQTLIIGVWYMCFWLNAQLNVLLFVLANNNHV